MHIRNLWKSIIIIVSMQWHKKKRNFERVEGNPNELEEQSKGNTSTRWRRAGEREYGVQPPQNPSLAWPMSISGDGEVFGLWQGRGTEGVGGREQTEVHVSRSGGGHRKSEDGEAEGVGVRKVEGVQCRRGRKREVEESDARVEGGGMEAFGSNAITTPWPGPLPQKKNLEQR